MTKYLIVNADDFGMCHSANLAIKDLVEKGAISSTTLISPASWSFEAVAMAKADDRFKVGVHLTHTSEWDSYRWGPLSGLDCLKDSEGRFPRSTHEALKMPLEARMQEALAQIAWCENMGIKIDHLDNHMRTLYDDLEPILKICAERGWGYRYPVDSNERFFGKDVHDFVLAKGIATPDYLNPNSNIYVRDCVTQKGDFDSFRAMLRHLPEGISEFVIHPALESDELKAIAPDWRIRVHDYQFFASAEFKQILAEENIELIGYQDIKRVRGLEEK